MTKNDVVRLSEAERVKVDALGKTGRAAARKRLPAQLLLKADAGAPGPAWTAAAMRQAGAISSRTVAHLRQCWVEAGLEPAWNGRPQARSNSPQLDGEPEAHVIALAGRAPPAGRNRWSWRAMGGPEGGAGAGRSGVV